MARARGAGALNAEQLFKCTLVFELSGAREQALNTLAQALAAGYSREQVRKEPELASLRRDPRFRKLVTKTE